MQHPAASAHGLLLAGVGRNGSSLVHHLTGLPQGVRRLHVTGSPIHVLQAAPSLIRVRSDGNWRSELSQALDGASLLLTLGSVTGREESFIPEVAALARSRGALSVAILVEPLLATSPARTDAGRLLKDVSKAADATILFPADTPQGAGLATLQEAMQRWTSRLANTLGGLLRAAAAQDTLNMHFADIAAVLSQHSRASVGVGRGQTVEDTLHHAAKNSLAPPVELLTARSVVAHLIGDSDMSLEDARRAGPVLEHLFPKAEVCCGVSVDGDIGEIRATIIAGKLDIAAARAADRRQTRQAETPFFKVGDPTVYDGEDLDVPTFIRKEIALPGGPPRPVPSQKTLFDGPARARTTT